MSVKYRVQLGAFTNKIYAGRENARGDAFSSKSDVTREAIEAVAQYLVANGDIYVPTSEGRSLRLSVEVIDVGP